MIVLGSPFKVNWTNFEDVCTYADKLGQGNLVYKDPSRHNYNITHCETYRLNPDWILYVVAP